MLGRPGAFGRRVSSRGEEKETFRLGTAGLRPQTRAQAGVAPSLRNDPTRSCERGGKLAAGLIILISFTLWITVELDSRGELPEIDELFSPGPGKMHPRAFTP